MTPRCVMVNGKLKLILNEHAMKTSEVSQLKNRILQLRASLYLIAFGQLDQTSIIKEAIQAINFDDKMKQDDNDSMGR